MIRWTRLEERNQNQDIWREQDKRREIEEPSKLAKERKINKKRMAERKGKLRNFKLKIWKMILGNDVQRRGIL